jgi:hypothetical protein
LYGFALRGGLKIDPNNYNQIPASKKLQRSNQKPKKKRKIFRAKKLIQHATRKNLAKLFLAIFLNSQLCHFERDLCFLRFGFSLFNFSF